MEINRVRWASRRGMLELDLILQPFVENDYAELSAEDQSKYDELLEEQDNDLFDWFIHKVEPPRPVLREIVGLIRERHLKRQL